MQKARLSFFSTSNEGQRGGRKGNRIYSSVSLSIYLYTLAVSPSLGGSRQHKRNRKNVLLLLWFICRPPTKDNVLALAGLFEALFYLFLHFVLLVYSFLTHVIGFSKQICFQSLFKLVNVTTGNLLYSLGALY